MNSRPIQHRLLIALIALAGVAVSAPAHAVENERAQIARERAEVEARYGERERECRGRFVVTSCIDDAKRERRQALDALRARELRLDEATRRTRTDARRAELAAKTAEDTRRDEEHAARAASAPPRTGKPFEPRRSASDAERTGHEPRDRPLTAGERLGIRPTEHGSEAERREREAASRERYDARQRQAAEHRREVEEKNAKRLQEHPPASPLPTPGASAPR